MIPTDTESEIRKVFNGCVLDFSADEPSIVNRFKVSGRPTTFQSFFSGSVEDKMTSWAETALSDKKKRPRDEPPPLGTFYFVHFMSCHPEVYDQDLQHNRLRCLIHRVQRQMIELFSGGIQREAMKWESEQIAKLKETKAHLEDALSQLADQAQYVIRDYERGVKDSFLVPVHQLEELIAEAKLAGHAIFAEYVELALWQSIGWEEAIKKLEGTEPGASLAIEWLFTELAEEPARLQRDLACLEALSGVRLREFLLFATGKVSEEDKVNIVRAWLLCHFEDQEKLAIRWHDCILWKNIPIKTRRDLLTSQQLASIPGDHTEFVDAVLKSLEQTHFFAADPSRGMPPSEPLAEGELNRVGSKLCGLLEDSDPEKITVVLGCLGKLGDQLDQLEVVYPKHLENLREMTYRAAWREQIFVTEYDRLMKSIQKLAFSIIRSHAVHSRTAESEVVVLQSEITQLQKQLSDRRKTLALITVPTLQDRYARRGSGDLTLAFKDGECTMFSSLLPEKLKKQEDWKQHLQHFTKKTGKDFVRFCHQMPCKGEPLELAQLLNRLEIFDDEAALRLTGELAPVCSSITRAILMMRTHPVGRLEESIYKKLHKGFRFLKWMDLLSEPWFNFLRDELLNEVSQKITATKNYAKALHPKDQETQHRYIQSYTSQIDWKKYPTTFRTLVESHPEYFGEELVISTRAEFFSLRQQKRKYQLGEGVTICERYGRERQGYDLKQHSKQKLTFGTTDCDIVWGCWKEGTILRIGGLMREGVLVVQIGKMQFPLKLDPRKRKLSSEYILKLPYKIDCSRIKVAIHEDG